MDLKDYFAKLIVEKETIKILGAHIIGPHASYSNTRNHKPYVHT